MDQPALLSGGCSIDDRGRVSFVNDFVFTGVKRFYSVENFSCATIRAFHGHRRETKYVYVARGSAIVAAVLMDDIHAPGKDNPVTRFILSSQKPSVLYIPPGYANGFRPLEEDTLLLFFSTATLEESKNDDYRFPADYWGRSIWEIEDR
jgi:dTDP-4-dehydrorhamnose 3,5-epimerase